MKLKEFIQTTNVALEEELLKIVNGEIQPGFSGMREMLAYQMGWEGEGSGEAARGKRIRPQMVLLSAYAFAGEWKAALPAAAAVELLHNFSLIHDDIEDGSDLRRGRPTVWKKWGIPQSINSGDAMFTLAQIAVLKLGEKLGADIGFEASKLLNQTCLVLTGGQHLDMLFEVRGDVKEAEYFQMIKGKTASLLAASMEFGAIIGKASMSQRTAAREFGLNLGIAFQVWDDWLGIWGDESKTGKSASSDLVNQKKTIPILYALERSGAFSKAIKGAKYDQAGIMGLVSALEEDGAKEYTENLAQDYTERALRALDAMKIDNQDAIEALLDLSTMLLNRKH